jgi:hypothetical protein
MDLSESDDAPSYAPNFVRLSRSESGHYRTIKAFDYSFFCLFGGRIWTFLEVVLVPQRGFEPLTHALRMQQARDANPIK